MTLKKCKLTTLETETNQERPSGFNMSAEDVGAVLGVSKTTILAEERKALAKAKRILRSKGIKAESFF
jgi:hypothetical protein